MSQPADAYPLPPSQEELQIKHELENLPNPYALDLDGELAARATEVLSRSREPYLDAATRPEMTAYGRDLAVYMLDGNDPFATLGMAVEGEVTEKVWRKSPEATQEELDPYKDNSILFLVVDLAPKDTATDTKTPRVAGILRVADMLAGPSETQNYFLSSKPEGTQLPPELQVSDIDKERGIWDVVGVYVRDEYRDGLTSPWAYHALYAASKELGIGRWIANLTESEDMNLDFMGIPFPKVEAAGESYMEREGKSPIRFTYHTCQVAEIEESMRARIAELEAAGGDFAKGAAIARIALFGSTEPNQ